MELLKLFPPQQFSLVAVILGMPLLGAFVNGVWGNRLGKPAVRLMALTAVGVSFIASVIAFFALHEHVVANDHEHVKLSWSAWEWMHTTGGRKTVPIDIKFSIDALSSVMMLVVTGVGFLIHLYSTSYMEKDKSFARYFAYLNLFIFSMLVLILGDNLPVLFVGWEGVGLCSYLLIGFWHTKMPNAAAGKKAFIANRIGDFGLICAMFLLVYYTGALDWTGMSDNAQSLVTTNVPDRIHVWPIGGGEYTGWLKWLQPSQPITISPATAIGLALLLGCAGKSAQIPLYVWLPDAMAGPTPVSALIHAATMVTAGVYLVCRMSFAFVLSPFTMMIVACVGAATALFAATIALVQNDIKKVLAYSTVSQLGFMFMGVGVGAFTAGFFHVFTHAFFKACLFLGAGSVIHAMHARVHDDEKAQDIRNMGGLRKYMPLTYWTFAASTAAIIGLPLTSGFFSKDEILYKAFVSHEVHPLQGYGLLTKSHLWEPPMWLGPVLYGVGLLAATMTAFYMCRMFFLTFWGDFRGWTIGRPSMLAKQALAAPVLESHAVAAHGDADAAHVDDDDAEHHHEEDLSIPSHPPHESPWQMTVPLIILAGFAVFAGVLNPGFQIFGDKPPPMDHWLEPVFDGIVPSGRAWAEIPHDMHTLSFELKCAIGGVSAFLIGTAVAYWMYVAQKGGPAKAIANSLPRLHKLVLNKWKIDEVYDATVLAAVDSLAETSAAVDKWVVDGILARATSVIVAALGTILRAFQTGVVHVYAAMMVVGLALVGAFFVMPHADMTMTSPQKGEYSILAAPGMGYSYRWDTENDGTAATRKYTDQNQVTVKAAKEPKSVKLEVINAFGLRATRDIAIPALASETKIISTGDR